jgi:hypothetical protein
MRQQFSVQEKPQGSFPGLTILGSVAGAFAAALTGAFVLVPVGLFGGLLGDAARCQVCGTPEDVHELLERKSTPEAKPIYYPRDPDFLEDKDLEDVTSQGYSYDESSGKFVLIPEGADQPADIVRESGIDWSIGPPLDAESPVSIAEAPTAGEAGLDFAGPDTASVGGDGISMGFGGSDGGGTDGSGGTGSAGSGSDGGGSSGGNSGSGGTGGGNA